MDTKAIFVTFSPKRIQAIKAVIIGIELNVKSVAATVVEVIAFKKQMPAPAKKMPAIKLGRPDEKIFRGAYLPCWTNINPKTATIKAIAR